MNSLFNSRVDVVFAGILAEHDVDGESATRDDEHGRVTEEIGKFRRIHRRRRHNQLQVLTTTHHLR